MPTTVNITLVTGDADAPATRVFGFPLVEIRARLVYAITLPSRDDEDGEATYNPNSMLVQIFVPTNDTDDYSIKIVSSNQTGTLTSNDGALIPVPAADDAVPGTGTPQNPQPYYLRTATFARPTKYAYVQIQVVKTTAPAAPLGKPLNLVNPNPTG